jgi:hypothetical protein
VGSRAVLDAVVKNFQRLSGLEPPIIQPVAQRYTTELTGSDPNTKEGVYVRQDEVT